MEKEDRKEEEKGFVVRDRRFSSPKEGEEAKPKKETAQEPKSEQLKAREPKSEGPSGGEAPLPPIDFVNFTHSLYISALIQLGEIADPATKESVKNLALAKQTIDLLVMLEQKTKGNLTPEEDKLMEHILYELRMRYVKATG